MISKLPFWNICKNIYYMTRCCHIMCDKINEKSSLSAKAFLTTEQRIPGVGNGVLQDILWNANIHPKKKLQDIKDKEKEKLFNSVKSTIMAMRMQGGRDTERDLFGCKGGYKTILSANTLKYPYPACGSGLIREAYMGGNIYFCPTCQPKEEN